MGQTIMERVDGIMAGVGCHQQANGEWIARTGPMNTKIGHGKTRAAAIASLRKKIERVVVNNMEAGRKD